MISKPRNLFRLLHSLNTDHDVPVAAANLSLNISVAFPASFLVVALGLDLLVLMNGVSYAELRGYQASGIILALYIVTQQVSHRLGFVGMRDHGTVASEAKLRK